MSLVVLTVAVLQTAVVPVLGVIASQLHATPTGVSWVVTANLLSAAGATPLIGRLADRYSKKAVLLAVLVVVLAGSLIAAATTSLALLIVGRVLQGASFGLYPVGVAILRAEFPEPVVVRALAVLSATLGFGGGIGLVVTGLLMSGQAGYHRVFWLATVFVVLVIAAVIALVPDRAGAGHGSIDWLGAVGLAAGLTGLILVVTQGSHWGWLAARTIMVAVAGLATLVAWWRWEGGRPHPLVSTSMLTRRTMLMTNLSTILVGVGLYVSFLGLTQFVQTSRTAAGYGFSSTVLYSSVVFLLPGALVGMVMATASGRFIDRFGAQAVLVVGAAIGAVGFTLLAVAHDARWQVIVAGVCMNIYVSLAYGALPAVVVGEAGPDETGIATGINAIARTIGSSIAAALVAGVLTASHGRQGLPAEAAFVALFVLGAVTAAAVAVLIAVSGVRNRVSEPSTGRVDAQALNHEWG
ncbi:MFS transporter [Mycobacterium vicinigordonae]|nr:MFS transporter [Mycobacterium vicinigordonae]